MSRTGVNSGYLHEKGSARNSVKGVRVHLFKLSSYLYLEKISQNNDLEFLSGLAMCDVPWKMKKFPDFGFQIDVKYVQLSSEGSLHCSGHIHTSIDQKVKHS